MRLIYFFFQYRKPPTRQKWQFENIWLWNGHIIQVVGSENNQLNFDTNEFSFSDKDCKEANGS